MKLPKNQLDFDMVSTTPTFVVSEECVPSDTTELSPHPQFPSLTRPSIVGRTQQIGTKILL